MKNFPFITAIITLIIIIGGIFLFSPKNPQQNQNNKSLPTNPSGYEFYWSLTCPHCENVEKFLTTWPKKDQIVINKFEVNTDRNNALNLMKRAESCNVDKESIGAVPLLYTPDGKCFLGDTPIIEYLDSLNI